MGRREEEEGGRGAGCDGGEWVKVCRRRARAQRENGQRIKVKVVNENSPSAHFPLCRMHPGMERRLTGAGGDKVEDEKETENVVVRY